MFCPKCGTQNGGGNAFCANCGAPLANNAPSAPQQQPAGNPGYYTPQAPGQSAQPGYVQAPVYGQTQTAVKTGLSRNSLIGIVTVAAAVVILVVVAVLIFGGGGNKLVGTWTGEVWGSEVSLTFKSNGTVIATSIGEDNPAKYTVKGNTLTIIDDYGSVSSGEYRIYNAGGKKALDMTFEGLTMTLYKK